MSAPDPLLRVRAIDTELVSLYARVDSLLRERAWITSPPPTPEPARWAGAAGGAGWAGGPGGAAGRGGGPGGAATGADGGSVDRSAGMGGSGMRPGREARALHPGSILAVSFSDVLINAFSPCIYTLVRNAG